jgi:hypothetical protein
MTRDPPEWPWLGPSHSFIILPPPPEPDRATCYAASLAADDLLEEVRAALRDGDDLSARMALHVLAGLVKVVTGQLGGSSPEHLVLQ